MKRMTGASLFDCSDSNVSAKPNSTLRPLESWNPKREAKIMGTIVKELNVPNVKNYPAPVSEAEYLTPDPSRRME